MYSKNSVIGTKRAEFNTNHVELEFHIVDQHDLFLEHFPGTPTLPGSFLVSYLVEIFQAQWNVGTIVEEVTFMQRIVPAGKYFGKAEMKDGVIRMMIKEFVTNNRVASITMKANV